MELQMCTWEVSGFNLPFFFPPFLSLCPRDRQLQTEIFRAVHGIDFYSRCMANSMQCCQIPTPLPNHQLEKAAELSWELTHVCWAFIFSTDTWALCSWCLRRSGDPSDTGLLCTWLQHHCSPLRSPCPPPGHCACHSSGATCLQTLTASFCSHGIKMSFGCMFSFEDVCGLVKTAGVERSTMSPCCAACPRAEI